MNINDMTKNDQLRAIIRELEAENRKLRDVALFVVRASDNDAYGYYTLEFEQAMYDRIKALVNNEVQE